MAELRVISAPTGGRPGGTDPLQEAWSADLARGASAEDLVRLAFEHCAEMVRTTAARLTGSRWEAEDVAQSVFIKLLDHAASLRDPSRVAGYVKTCAVRESLRVMKRRRWWSGRRAQLVVADHDTSTASDTAYVAARVDQALSRLGAEERAAVVLRAMGHSHDEVAELLGTSVATARRRLKSARAKVAAITDDDGLGRAMLAGLGEDR